MRPIPAPAAVLFALIATAHAPAQSCPEVQVSASDGVLENWFGFALGVSANTVAVGAYGDRTQGYFTGAVYIYQSGDAGQNDWTEKTKLLAPDATESDYFGVSLALEGDTLVAGAPQYFPAFDPGKTHVFRRVDASTWVHHQRLDGSTAGPAARFGRSVALDGNTIVVGSPEDYYLADPGSAYVFERISGNIWEEHAVLRAADGAGQDCFGQSVGVSGDALIVGAYQDDDRGESSGSAYIFRRQPDGSWVQEAKLLPTTGSPGDRFGFSVAIRGDTALVSAPRAHIARGTGAGYVFHRGPAGWVQEGLLTSDQLVSPHIGESVALTDNLALIGGPQEDATTGAAYLFRYDAAGGWARVRRLTASPSSPPTRPTTREPTSTATAPCP